MQQSTFLYKPVIFTLITLYLVACFSPLRLEFDSVRYFAIKDCIEAGCAPESPAAKDFLPYGYPVLLAGLSATGLLNSFSIAFINGIFLLGSLVLTRKIMNPRSPLLFYSIILLNWTLIKLFAYPLSEMQYLFFSASGIYCFYRYTKTKNGWMLLFSFLLSVLAFFTRTIGMALIVSLVIGLAWEHRKLFRKKIFLIGALTIVSVLIVLALSTLPGIPHYFDALLYRPGRVELFVKHVREWGQLLLNMPMGALKTYLLEGWVNAIFLLAGLVLLAWFIFSLIRRSSTIPAVVIIYLVIYSLVMFNWSHYDPRFWVPVLPFIAGIILLAPLPKWIPAVFVAYSLMGMAAFGYSFYTQFNKKAFARTQANGIYRKEYETHFFGKVLPDTANSEVLKLLEKYD